MEINYKNWALFFICANFCMLAYSQTKCDSVKFAEDHYKIKHHINVGEHEIALRLIDSLLIISGCTTDTSKWVSIELLRVSILFSNKDYYKTDSILLLIEEIYMGRTKDEFYFNSLAQRGIWHHLQDELDEAYSTYQNALKSTEVVTLRNFKLRSRLLINMAMINKNWYKYERSIGQLHQAEEIISKYGVNENDSDVVGSKYRIYNTLGTLFYRIADINNAISYYKKSYDLYPETSPSKFIVLVNLVDTYIVADSLNSALNLISNSLTDQAEIGFKEKLYLKLNLIEIYTIQELYSKALPIIKEIQILSQDKQFRSKYYPRYYKILGKYWLQTNNYDKAITLFSKREKLLASTNKYNSLISTYKYLTACYLGGNEEGTNSFERFLALKDSIYQLNLNSQIEEINTKYETEKKELENQLLNSKNTAYQAEIKSKNTLLGGGVLGISSLGILSLLLYKRNKERKASNQQLSKQNEKICTLNKEIVHRSKNNLVLATTILSMQRRQAKEGTTKETLQDAENRINSIASVSKQLNQSTDTDLINMKSYLSELLENLSYSIGNDKVQVVKSIDDIQLNSEQAIRVGLITNELFTNSIKHAFSGIENPRVDYSLTKVEDQIQMIYNDNGPGIKKDTSPSDGQILIKSLADQLHAELQEFNLTNGYSTRLTIPIA